MDESIIVALGGNLTAEGRSVEEGLEAAIAAFPALGLQVVRCSSLWWSAAWPNPADPPFLNAVALVATSLGPGPTMAALHDLEARYGRVRGLPNAPRTLDIDLIAYGRLVRDRDPILPHPRAAERLFVMGPLAEIAPGWRHPLSDDSVEALADRATVGRDARSLRR